MKTTAELKRPYHQTARAAATAANAERILHAFRARLERQWFDEMRLDDVAHDAGVTVQTVIRRFGGKEGLLDSTVDLIAQEVMAMRAMPAGDTAAIVRGLLDDYEVNGDLVMRMLAQEDRFPPMRRMTDVGRREHRQWIATVFADRLAGLPEADAQRRLDALVVATDLYIWKLIRRDMGRPIAELQALMERLVQSALSDSSPAPDLHHA
jgi:AcrR family transcriptional regulator